MTEISRHRYNEAMVTYYGLVGEMPANYKSQFPAFPVFISPQGLVGLLNHTDAYDDDDIWLSITAERRINALLGPHAHTMLMAWAAQRMEHKGVEHE